jgi:hypothetical protein
LKIIQTFRFLKKTELCGEICLDLGAYYKNQRVVTGTHNSPPSDAEVKSSWSYIYLPYAFNV